MINTTESSNIYLYSGLLQTGNNISLSNKINTNTQNPQISNTETKNNANTVNANTDIKSPNSSKSTFDKLKIKECKTCKSRKYQDSSSDPAASMQTATSLSPNASFSAVMSHERGHIDHEETRSQSKGGSVIQSHVQIFVDKCPECGKMYVCGGKAITYSVEKTKSTNTANKGLVLDQKV